MTGAAQRHRRPPQGGHGDAVPLESSPGAEAALAVADAVLYEGYLLYPYRRSATKNQVRWQFGVLAPRAVVEAAGPVRPTVAGSAETWQQQTEVLLEAADDAVVQVRLRFLQLQHRAVERAAPDGRWVPVDRLDVAGQRLLGFDEAVPREIDLCAPVRELGAPRTVPVDLPGGTDVEPLTDGGVVVGRLVRTRRPVSATVRVHAQPARAPFPLSRLRVVVENGVTDVAADTPRPEVLRRSLVAAHTVLGVTGGRFVSLLEPPEWATAAARACRNLHTFPVLAGAPGSRDLVLSSPVILYDHPAIAPESPGALFDSGEIDEILSLRTLTLTDDEKAEARATDPRAAELLDRVEALSEEALAGLHGTVRSFRPVEPDPDVVLVGGARITPGSRVRLHPRRHGTDAQDVFLAGRTATVERVLHDVDGSRFVAVTVDDDPGADLFDWYGRHYQFTPDEIEVAE
jgi:hypothetical protein